jgi:hypothetical protein
MVREPLNLPPFRANNTDKLLDTNDQLLAGIWDDFVDELKDAETFAVSFIKDLLDLLKSKGGVDIVSVFAKLTSDVVGIVMDTLENATDIFLKIIRLCIGSVKALGNYEIECPIFSNLWKLITNGRPLTLFNFCSLLASIPTTILMKVVAGRKPPALKGRLTGNTFGQFIEEGTVSTDQTLPDDIRSYITPAIVSTFFLSSRVTAIGLLVDSLFEGEEMELPTGFVNASIYSLAHPTFHVAEGGTDVWGNVFDTLSFLFETAGLIFGWPPHHMHSDQLEYIDLFRWGVRFTNETE